MKCYKRYLSAFVCCVLLFLVSSTNVSAESVDVSPYDVYQMVWGGSEEVVHEMTFTPNNGVKEYQNLTYNFYHTPNVDFPITTYLKFTSNSGTLIKKGNTAKVTINGVYYLHLYTVGGGIFESRAFDSANVMVYYKDGTIDYNISVDKVLQGDAYNFTFEIEPKKDIYAFSLTINDSVNFKSNPPFKFQYPIGEYLGDNSSYTIDIEQKSETNSLLGSIINWVKEILDVIINGFTALLEFLETLLTDVVRWLSDIKDSIFNGLVNVVNTLIELPSKLWTLIENGLKALFVPSDDFINTYKYNYETLLEERFGLLHLARELIIDVFISIDTSVETNSVEMPLVNLNSVGIPFSFGGYNVKVIPDGFGFLAIACKSITSILVVVYFMNALRRLYDELMGVEK